MEELSGAARAALVNCVGRTGSKVRVNGGVWNELRNAGLISVDSNLTRKGVGIRAEVFAKMLDVEL